MNEKRFEEKGQLVLWVNANKGQPNNTMEDQAVCRERGGEGGRVEGREEEREREAEEGG